MIIRLSEAASSHEKRLSEQAEAFETRVRRNLEAGAFYSAVDVIKALRLRSVLMEEIRRAFEVCDVMSVPPSNPEPRLDDDATLSSAASKPAERAKPWQLNGAEGGT